MNHNVIELIVKKRDAILLNELIYYNDDDIMALNPADITLETIKMASYYNNYAFDDDCENVIDVSKVSIDNMDVIRRVIDDEKLLAMIEKILGLLEGRINGDIKIGIKMRCILYLREYKRYADDKRTIQSIKLDKINLLKN